MNILVLNGSPRPKGNTKQMVNAFEEGAESAGHKVYVVDVCKKKIAGCLACEYCHTKGNGQCVQKDDMQQVYDLLDDAEMLVIAAPIYYHGLSGQMKCTIDRFYAKLYPNKPEKLSKVSMFLSSGDPDMPCMMLHSSRSKGILRITSDLRTWVYLRTAAMTRDYPKPKWNH